MDDKLRSEVMDDIEGLKGSYYKSRQQIGYRLQQVMADYEHLEHQVFQAKGIIEALLSLGREDPIDSDAYFSTMSHAKEFLEDKDGAS